LGPAKSGTVLDPSSSLESDISQSETVRVTLATLPEEHRQVVVLRHLVGLAPREIADHMGWTVGSIHGLHHRGRRALQREMASLESTPCTRAVRHLTAV
jgi:RNA polymerase sigma factor (sigma-70 family)